MQPFVFGVQFAFGPYNLRSGIVVRIAGAIAIPVFLVYACGSVSQEESTMLCEIEIRSYEGNEVKVNRDDPFDLGLQRFSVDLVAGVIVTGLESAGGDRDLSMYIRDIENDGRVFRASYMTSLNGIAPHTGEAALTIYLNDTRKNKPFELAENEGLATGMCSFAKQE